MPKKKLTIAIDEDLITQAREYEINFSSFLEIRLRDYLAIVTGLSKDVNVSGLSRDRTGDLRRVKATS